ncbi:hypothetical protein SDC9_114088 [bioreactor metagenome]|uniref:Uncharacterized protein n=1 Tax=bioreactor metagenome TaxID=1076179 RepID=A0A645BRC8_9ZZZZ
MRRQAEIDQRLVQPFLANGQPLVDVVGGIAGVRGGKFQCGDTQRCAHAGFCGSTGGGVRIEIHVVEAGDATFQHFGAGQAGSVIDELRREVGAFGRPDVFLQPLHQRQVVGDASHQGHRGMGVQIDQAGDQDVVVKLGVR